MGALVDNIPRIQRSGRLKQQEPALFLSDWLVLDAARDHHELALLDPLVAVAIFHAEAALNDEEQLVFVVVVVEDKLSLDFVEFHVLAVKFGGDLGLPVLGDLRELFDKVDLGHGFRIISGGERSQRN
jgi:hypothetical protein